MSAGQCAECPPGTFRAQPGGRTLYDCANCSAGTFASSPGNEQCGGRCPLGKHSRTSHAGDGHLGRTETRRSLLRDAARRMELAQIAEAWSGTTGTGADIARWGDAAARRHGVFWVVQGTPTGALMVHEADGAVYRVLGRGCLQSSTL